MPSLIYFTNATYDAKRQVTGLYANAQIDDDGPNMETYHEGTYHCSRVGHAACQPDLRSDRAHRQQSDLWRLRLGTKLPLLW